MAYHAFERICSLWFERVKHHFVIENYPIRVKRKKNSKYSPHSSTTDFDLISFDQNEPNKLNLVECKSNINQTAITKARTRLLKQLNEMENLGRKTPFTKDIKRFERWVIGIKIANRITSKIPKGVKLIEGQEFEDTVLNDLIMLVGEDPRIDPKDEILSIVRLFWHFGILNDKYYAKQADTIYRANKKISAGHMRKQLGLIATREKLDFAKRLLAQAKNNQT